MDVLTYKSQIPRRMHIYIWIVWFATQICHAKSIVDKFTSNLQSISKMSSRKIHYIYVIDNIIYERWKTTFLICSRASVLILHRSVQSWTPVIKTPWCFSLSKEVAGLIKFSAKSGTFFMILIEHNAAYITVSTVNLWE